MPKVLSSSAPQLLSLSALQVNAGISVVPGAGGSSKCVALCTNDADYMECKLNTVNPKPQTPNPKPHL